MRVAFAAAVGGAGATRSALECAAMLARDGRSAAVLDASFATQGLADHLPGRIAPDVTTLVIDGDPLRAGLVDLPLDPDRKGEHGLADDRSGGAGRLAVCPARAPFERVARAKTTEAARRLGDLATEAAGEFDHVLLDVPPVAANQAVAAVNAADRVTVVTPATARGTDALSRARDRFDDIGAGADATLLTFAGDGTTGVDADAAFPASEIVAPAACPVAGAAGGTFPAAVAAATETLFDVSLDVDVGEGGLFG